MDVKATRLLTYKFDLSFHFYKHTLGLELIWGSEESPYAAFLLPGGNTLSLFRAEVMESVSHGREHILKSVGFEKKAHVCIYCNDITFFVSRLKIRRKAFIMEKQQRTHLPQQLHLRDPEGNVVTIKEDERYQEQNEKAT